MALHVSYLSGQFYKFLHRRIDRNPDPIVQFVFVVPIRPHDHVHDLKREREREQPVVRRKLPEP